MDLSIIIPTYNRGDVFRQTIEAAVNAVSNLDAEVIVVNDYKKAIPEVPQHPRLRLVNNPKSGVASARNLGASLATGQLLLFLDDDVVITAQNLQRSIELFRLHPDWCVNPNWVYPPQLQQQMEKTHFGRYMRFYQLDSLQGWRKGLFWDDKNVFRVDNGASYCLAIAAAVFKKSNGYDERFPFSGAEDFEFMERLKKMNIPVMIDPLCFVYHNESDRLEMRQFMARKERNGETRKMAADMGYSEVEIAYSRWQRLFYGALSRFPTLPSLLLSVVPNTGRFDSISRKVIDVMHATYLYKGYTKKKKHETIT